MHVGSQCCETAVCYSPAHVRNSFACCGCLHHVPLLAVIIIQTPESSPRWKLDNWKEHCGVGTLHDVYAEIRRQEMVRKAGHHHLSSASWHCNMSQFSFPALPNVACYHATCACCTQTEQHPAPTQSCTLASAPGHSPGFPLMPASHVCMQLPQVMTELVDRDTAGCWARAAGAREWGLLQWCQLMYLMSAFDDLIGSQNSSQLSQQAANASTVAAFKALLGLAVLDLTVAGNEEVCVVRTLRLVTEGLMPEGGGTSPLHLLMAQMLLRCEEYMKAVWEHMAAGGEYLDEYLFEMVFGAFCAHEVLRANDVLHGDDVGSTQRLIDDSGMTQAFVRFMQSTCTALQVGQIHSASDACMQGVANVVSYLPSPAGLSYVACM